MKGDYTRFTFDPAKHYTAVRKQQGRVDLDADWNEEIDIHSHLEALEALDVIGECGVPKKTAGFTVDILPDGSDITLSAGRFYANGLLCETEATSYLTQPNLPNPPALVPENGRTDLVYLEAWQRHVTALEDEDLLEPALGGADTTTRLQTVWQVKVRPGVSATECEGDVGTWPPVPPLEGRGTLTTSVASSSTTTNLCLIAPGGGYRGLENRLYRVEIHDGGQPYAWPRPAGVISTVASPVSGQKYQVKVTDWTADGVAWYVGQTIELHNTQTDNAGKGGTLARITAADSASQTLTLDTDISSLSAAGLKLRRVATYKWSRDNGAVASAIKEFVSGEPKKVVLRRLGRDQVLTVHPNDWVEVSGDSCDLGGWPGTTAAIAAGGIDEAEMKLTLSADVSAHGAETHPKLRRWDQKSAPQAVTGEEIELEDGIKIRFGGKDLQPGDYWCFAARTATGDIDTLTDAPPMGVERSFCRLALVQWKSNTASPTSFIGSVIAECPPAFPPLTDIWAEDVSYDNTGCASIDAENVQEAIDQLCAQRNLPHHNKHLHGWGIVCGLRVVCGPEELDTPGDQVSVVVQPGYALDCEGQDIIFEKEQQIQLLELVKDWEKRNPNSKPLLTEKDGKLEGSVSLIIERDEHGKPRLDLRPYDPSDDKLSAMLQGTLLMDFIHECITEPLKEIQDYLEKPTGDFDKGSIVPPKRQQLIAVVNLIWQLFKSQYGAHIFLSQKEHTILENLYYKLAEILSSKTFCGMFHEDAFPDYPFPRHAVTTLFGQDAYRRIRIHPGGELGYALGTRGKIGVFDLVDDVLIEELTFPGGEALVQDVAFSADGRRMHAVALSPGGDTLMASASIDRTRHQWGAVKPVCGYSFLTLCSTKSNKLYGVARAKGLFLMNPDLDVVNPEPVGASFYATGHLLMDQAESNAYASAASTSDLAMKGYYNQVLKLNLTTGASTTYPFVALVGNDDIALSPDEKYLFAVVNPKAGSSGNKSLLVILESSANVAAHLIDLESDTVIRLLALPGRQYLAISYEDCYWLRLFETSKLGLSSVFHLPVQISPIGMACGRMLEDTEPGKKIKDRQKRDLRDLKMLRMYVLNGISSTLTAFPEPYLTLSASPAPAPAPGSAAFLAALKEYRQKILYAFLGLIGAVWQSLKDCFCDRLLVDCPACSAADEVYLAKISVKESEVYQVCNFSKRKYVKSFPTVDYWLSIVPVLPLLNKAVEKICCAILPNWFQNLGKRPADVQMVNGLRMRQTYHLAQQQGVKATVQKATMKTSAVSLVAADWLGASLDQATRPPMLSVSQDRVIGQPVAAAQENLKAAEVSSSVEPYDPARGLKNLQVFAGTPMDLQPGTKVTLYEENGVVRYYALTEETDARIAALRQEVDTQKLDIVALKGEAGAGVIGPARAAAGTAVPSADLETLRSELKAIQSQAAEKDKELGALRAKLEALEKKQSSDIRALRKDIDKKSGG
jgi:hypothetical protein